MHWPGIPGFMPMPAFMPMPIMGFIGMAIMGFMGMPIMPIMGMPIMGIPMGIRMPAKPGFPQDSFQHQLWRQL